MSGIRRSGRLERVLVAGGKRARLAEHSRQVILAGQTREGAYLAAPTFPTYRYSWFRDGAFIADAMDLIGETASAAAFHGWTLRVLEPQLDERGDVLGDVLGDTPGQAVLHTRYLPDGTFGAEDWPNFQLDGFGTWLWAYRQHVQRHTLTAAPGSPGSQGTSYTALDSAAREVIRRLALYLARRWSQPNFDCWEEHPHEVHPSTLGAIYAGLRAAAELLEDRWFLGVADAVRAYLLTHGLVAGSFAKHVGSNVVDANLLWLAEPYQVVPADDARFSATLERISATLQDPDGGVHRYARDTFYGGGSWPLLTADLAQVHLARGETTKAERLLAWIEARATADGDIPEQVATHANDAAYLPEWVDRWGTSACPLLWSHAAYLRLLVAFEAHRSIDGTSERTNDRPSDAANDAANESPDDRTSDRAAAGATDRSTDGASDTSTDRSNTRRSTHDHP